MEEMLLEAILYLSINILLKQEYSIQKIITELVQVKNGNMEKSFQKHYNEAVKALPEPSKEIEDIAKVVFDKDGRKFSFLFEVKSYNIYTKYKKDILYSDIFYRWSFLGMKEE